MLSYKKYILLAVWAIHYCCLTISSKAVQRSVPVSKTVAAALLTQIAEHYLRSFTTLPQGETGSFDKVNDKKEPSAHEVRPPDLDAITIRKTIFNTILAKSKMLLAFEQQREPILNPYA